jgi:hypothetical protein
LRPFLASYGGGHHRITGALARALIDRGDEPVLMGFTTAYRALLRDGLPARAVTDLIDPEGDAMWLERAAEFTGGPGHPDILSEETQAYFAIGLRDLAAAEGLDAAIDLVRDKGRFAFEPVATMRRYLQRLRPDVVIATTSPRFEAATLKAARLEGIPSLAVGDLFLSNSLGLILSQGYAEHLAVLTEDVAERIVSAGFPAHRVHVTGNPAFDTLAPRADASAMRTRLRERLGIGDRRVILWPGNAATAIPDGRPLATSEAAVAALERICARDPALTYVFRRHPNAPSAPPENLRTGIFDDGERPVEETLLAADIVCAEVSTVALQAALMGKPVVAVGLHDYSEYARFGLAYPVPTLDDLDGVLAHRDLAPKPLRMPPLGTATAAVLALVDRLSRRGGVE